MFGSFSRVVFTLFFTASLSACSSWYRVNDANYRQPPNLSRPGITPGQKAHINADSARNEYLIEAIRQTKLFSSVEYTPSRQPIPSGVYINITETGTYPAADSGFVGTMYYLVSLGLIPDPMCRSIQRVYSIDIFQNGIQIARTDASVKWDQMCGMWALFMSEKDATRNEAGILVNRLIDGLNKK